MIPVVVKDGHMPDMVKVRVRFKPSEDLPSSEDLWAEPVDEAAGTYRLQNSSFMVPLGAGDVVGAQPAGDGVLQVVELVGPGPSILTVVAAPPGVDLDLQPIVEEWSALGAVWTEGRSGMLVTTWSEQMRLEQIEAVIRPSAARGLTWLSTEFPASRVAANMPEIDFTPMG